jgi:hypothetical protein
MQHVGELHNVWIMFDHVKRVVGYITMTYHVYNPTYCKVFIVVVCDMQSEDTKAQRLMWTKLNQTMLKHGSPKPKFKGFMVDSA